jgi:hypothetical protein
VQVHCLKKEYRGYLFKTLGFICVALSVDIGMYCVLFLAFQHTEAGEEASSFINQARRKKADIVILGDSRALCNIDPVTLQSAVNRTVFNAGCNGQGILYMRGVVDLLLQTYRPKLFIIHVDPRSIANYSRRENIDRITALSVFIDQSKIIREMIYSRGRWEHLKYISLSFRFNGKVRSIIKDLIRKNYDKERFMRLDRVLDRARIIKGKKGEEEYKAVADAFLVETLRETIRKVRGSDVGVVLVSSPYWGLDYMNSSDYKELSVKLENIAVEENIPYLSVNERSYPIFRDATLFADESHLNGRGASFLSALVGDWITKSGIAAGVN